MKCLLVCSVSQPSILGPGAMQPATGHAVMLRPTQGPAAQAQGRAMCNAIHHNLPETTSQFTGRTLTMQQF